MEKVEKVGKIKMGRFWSGYIGYIESAADEGVPRTTGKRKR